MSVSHPLLKKLKGYIYDMRKDENIEVHDHHPSLLPLCLTLEEIFQTGLKILRLRSPFGLMKKDYWFWIHLLYEQKDKYSVPFSVVQVLESVTESKKVYTYIGRGRLFLRTSLLNKVLQTVVQLLLSDEVFLFTTYDPKSSILGNEIMSGIFLSLLHELNKINFKLELKNSSFLDDTWNLGVYKKFEFVPCKEMGITFAYIQGRVVVVKVDEGSVAAEDNQIEPGDVLDELYGQSLYRCNRGLISSLAKKYRGLPIYLSVVKGSYIGSIYSPLKPIFEKLNIKRLHVKEEKESDFVQELSSDSSSGCLKFNLELIGKFQVDVGEKAECIDRVISKAIDLKLNPLEVEMYVTERDLKICDAETNEVLVDKHFSQISACGRKKIFPEVFAFIFGNTSCTIADKFKCFVLKAKSSSAISTILDLIAHGFVKTHWEV